jgi:hypothetical protein
MKLMSFDENSSFRFEPAAVFDAENSLRDLILSCILNARVQAIKSLDSSINTLKTDLAAFVAKLPVASAKNSDDAGATVSASVSGSKAVMVRPTKLVRNRSSSSTTPSSEPPAAAASAPSAPPAPSEPVTSESVAQPGSESIEKPAEETPEVSNHPAVSAPMFPARVVCGCVRV